MAECYIGTSGFSYNEWRGAFYPQDLPAREWLHFYATKFTTVEINNTFYHLPRAATVQGWYGQTPADFTFAVKMSRFVSHLKHLHMDEQGRDGVHRFFESVALLQQKLGVVLTQLPASTKRDDALLRDYLAVLRGVAGDVRLAMEFRHESWFMPETFGVLKQYNVANVWNSAPRMALSLEPTADFAYARLHGSTRLYASDYSDDELRDWATRLKNLGGYVYFDNTMHGNAPKNARTLREFLV